MYRLRILLLAIVALLISAAVTFFLYRRISTGTEIPEDNSSPGIVVAAMKVNLGDRLTEQSVSLIPWPENTPLTGSFHRVEEVIGRGVIIPLLPNEPILESKLAPQGAGAGLTSAIPEGMRAISVKVNEVIGVAGFVLPGTRVDVIVTGTPTGDRDQEVSKVVLENVEVLAAGQNVERDAAGTPQEVAVVTLLVTPEDAQRLALASVDARIQLALRNPLDLERRTPNAVQRSALYRDQQAEPPAPAPPRPRPRPQETPPPAPPPPATKKFEVEVIQGAQRQTVTIEKKPAPPSPPSNQGRP